MTGAGMAATQAEMFPTQVRYSGASFSYNIAYALFGGSAPLLSAFLIDRTGNLSSPGVYIAALAVVVLFFVAAAPETYRVSLNALRPVAAEITRPEATSEAEKGSATDADAGTGRLAPEPDTAEPKKAAL
jgi:hypothetical protein